MQKVALLTTGGTIASNINKDSGKLSSGKLTGEELTSLIEMPNDVELVTESIFQKPSMHITFDDLITLKTRIEEYLTDDTINGVVVTHGTDSLEETAYFLDLTIDNKKPIIITGSQRSIGDYGSDVYVNLRHAIYAATSKDLLNVGTVVVFNERIFSAKHVKKEHASNIQGFNSFGFGYLGIIDNDVVYIYQRPIRKEVFNIKGILPDVEIIKCYLNADGKFIKATREAGAKGIVLEGVGRGQVAPEMVEEIKNAIDDGIKVVITSSTEEGAVYPTYDYSGSTYDLYNNGVILGNDFDSKKARIRLAVLLAAESLEFEF